MTVSGSENYTVDYNYNDSEGYKALLQTETKTYESEDNQNTGTVSETTVYTYDKKPAMIIFYTGGPSEKEINIETKILDSRFKKHEDYYVAFMATKLQACHPAAKRVLKNLKERWKTMLKREQKEVQESVSDSIINGFYDEKLELIQEAVNEKLIDQDTANIYITMMKKSEFKIDDFPVM